MNPFEHYLTNANAALDALSVSDAERDRLTKPDRVIEKTITVTRDSGEPKTLTAYRVQSSNARGPYKGGIRFHPAADLAEVEMLAGAMAVKTAVLDLPLGGAKGAVVLDPKQYSARELEAIARGYAREMAPYLGVDTDIPAPDVYTNAELMAYMLDEYETTVGRSEPGMITGKPLVLGGSQGRDTATARGGVFALEAYVSGANLDRTTLRVAIQGFGNAGQNAAFFLHALGYRIVAISDSAGGIYNPNGINPHHAWNIKQEKKSLSGMYCEGSMCDESALTADGATIITNAELVTCDCDILIPAALDNQIHEENAASVQARIILELANGPTTPVADKILSEHSVTVIPDVLANAGGVTVSYFEWVQNRTQYYWSETEIEARLKERMTQAFEDVQVRAAQDSITLREAAYRIGFSRILEAVRARGLT